jgi:peroxiredoxin
MSKYVLLAFGAVFALAASGCSRGEAAGASVSAAPTSVPTTTGAEAVVSSTPPQSAPQLAADDPGIPEGTAAPDFTVQVDGKSLKLSELKGHPVMLDFWATWCGPCVASLPHTQEVYEKGKDVGLQVIAISDESNDTVSKFIKENKYTFPVGLDAKDEASSAYKVDGIPTTVVIDKDGKVVTYILGGGQDEEINKALAKVGVTVQ